MTDRNEAFGGTFKKPLKCASSFESYSRVVVFTNGMRNLIPLRMHENISDSDTY